MSCELHLRPDRQGQQCRQQTDQADQINVQTQTDSWSEYILRDMERQKAKETAEKESERVTARAERERD